MSDYGNTGDLPQLGTPQLDGIRPQIPQVALDNNLLSSLSMAVQLAKTQQVTWISNAVIILYELSILNPLARIWQVAMIFNAVIILYELSILNPLARTQQVALIFDVVIILVCMNKHFTIVQFLWNLLWVYIHFGMLFVTFAFIFLNPPLPLEFRPSPSSSLTLRVGKNHVFFSKKTKNHLFLKKNQINHWIFFGLKVFFD